jgi:hypothetical protein
VARPNHSSWWPLREILEPESRCAARQSAGRATARVHGLRNRRNVGGNPDSPFGHLPFPLPFTYIYGHGQSADDLLEP